MELSDFFKNCCENNATYFKEFIGKFKPKTDLVEKFNNRNWTMIFDMYVRLESYANCFLSWVKRNEKLVSTDRPELFEFHQRNFETLSEIVNGPCPDNQRIVYRYRTDIFMGLIIREVDDVNSSFYSLKSKVLEYI